MQVDVASKNQNEQLVNSGADLHEKNLTSKKKSKRRMKKNNPGKKKGP